MAGLIVHPVVLGLTALCCAPVLIPLARFFFDDFASFKAEAGLKSSIDVLLWAVGQPRQSWHFQFKVVGLIGSYCVLVFLAYVTASRILG